MMLSWVSHHISYTTQQHCISFCTFNIIISLFLWQNVWPCVSWGCWHQNIYNHKPYKRMVSLLYESSCVLSSWMTVRNPFCKQSTYAAGPQGLQYVHIVGALSNLPWPWTFCHNLHRQGFYPSASAYGQSSSFYFWRSFYKLHRQTAFHFHDSSGVF